MLLGSYVLLTERTLINALGTVTGNDEFVIRFTQSHPEPSEAMNNAPRHGMGMISITVDRIGHGIVVALAARPCKIIAQTRSGASR